MFDIFYLFGAFFVTNVLVILVIIFGIPSYSKVTVKLDLVEQYIQVTLYCGLIKYYICCCADQKVVTTTYTLSTVEAVETCFGVRKHGLSIKMDHKSTIRTPCLFSAHNCEKVTLAFLRYKRSLRTEPLYGNLNASEQKPVVSTGAVNASSEPSFQAPSATDSLPPYMRVAPSSSSSSATKVPLSMDSLPP
jgi:hypothetical protein